MTMKALPISLSLALTVISCRGPKWKTETYTYDNLARETISENTPIRIYYQKTDIKFSYKIIGRAHAISSKKQSYQDPVPVKLLQDQARKIGGHALLPPSLNDKYTWTAPIIQLIDQ